MWIVAIYNRLLLDEVNSKQVPGYQRVLKISECYRAVLRRDFDIRCKIKEVSQPWTLLLIFIERFCLWEKLS